MLIDGVPATPVQNVRDLGIYIDGDLSMRTHVQRTTSSCFDALRQLRQMRRLVPTATFQTLTVALVNQRLDYGNSTLVGIPAYLMRILQSALNAAARLIVHLRRSDHITDALVSLHWLRVPERIQFKIAVQTYRVLHGNAPRYLGPLTLLLMSLVEELCALPELTVWSCLQSDWLLSAAELFRLPLPTPGTLFLNASSQLHCSHLSVI